MFAVMHMGMMRADCIFTGWAGSRSPIEAVFASANIRNSVFRNMDLAVEVVDISFGGLTVLSDVLLANVSLQHGQVVSTTMNDYHVLGLGTGLLGYDDMAYYADFDAHYDVSVTNTPSSQRGMFGAEWHVEHSALIDCIPEAVSEAISARTLAPTPARADTIGTGLSVCVLGMPKINITEDHVLPPELYPKPVVGKVGRMLKKDDAWFKQMQQVCLLASL